jgi:hypothetical protein
VDIYAWQIGFYSDSAQEGWLDVHDDDGSVGFKGTPAEILAEINALRYALDEAEEAVSQW